MDRPAVWAACLSLACWLSVCAAEPVPRGATLTAAVQAADAPPRLAPPKSPLQAVPTSPGEEGGDPPTSRPWLLVLSVVVLAGVMARRRL